MFTSLYTVPVSAWAGLVAVALAVPILVHLINLLRYRKVQWAAMEFLMKGHRKKRKRVWWTQLSLIACRCLVGLLAVLLFGRVSCRQEVGLYPSGTSHFVLLDDSYSMGEEVLAQVQTLTSQRDLRKQSCFENASQSILGLAEKLAQWPDQRMVIALSSRPFDQAKTFECNSSVVERLKEFLGSQGVSEMSASPLQWMEQQLVRVPAGPFYLFSDFRAVDFDGEDARATLKKLRQEKPDLQLVVCTGVPETDNLSLNALEPENGLVSAGVPFYMTLKVENRSAETRRNIEIGVRTARLDSGVQELEFLEGSPAMIPELEAGETATLQLPFVVPAAGEILYEASLDHDSLPVDNVAHRILEVQLTNRLLLIGDRGRDAVSYLQWVFQPEIRGSAVNTGFQTDLVTANEFAMADDELGNYAAVYLLSDDLADPRLIQRLEDYVQQGGLLFVSPGGFADIERFNRRLHKGGQGLVPCPIEAATLISERTGSTETDISILAENLARFFEGETAKLLSDVRFYRKFFPPRGWKAAGDVKILASLRGRARTPLIIQSPFGRGKVVTLLSPFDNQWNNWARNPTFVVLVYQLIFVNRKWISDNELRVGDRLQESTVAIPKSSSMSRLLVRSSSSSVGVQKTSVSVEKREEFVFRRKGVCQLTGLARPFVVGLDFRDSQMSPAAVEQFARSGISDRQMVSWGEVKMDTGSPVDRGENGVLLTLLLLLFFEQWLARRVGFQSVAKTARGTTRGSEGIS